MAEPDLTCDESDLGCRPIGRRQTHASRGHHAAISPTDGPSPGGPPCQRTNALWQWPGHLCAGALPLRAGRTASPQQACLRAARFIPVQTPSDLTWYRNALFTPAGTRADRLNLALHAPVTPPSRNHATLPEPRSEVRHVCYPPPAPWTPRRPRFRAAGPPRLAPTPSHRVADAQTRGPCETDRTSRRVLTIAAGFRHVP